MSDLAAARRSRASTIFVAVLALLAAAARLAAQSSPAVGLPPALDARLRQIFEKEEFKEKNVGPVRWLEDGRSYALREDAPAGKDLYDVALYDTATGKRRILAAAARLVPPGATAPLKVEDFTVSPDQRKLLIFTDSKKVWRRNTSGDYWVFDRGSGTLRKLGGGAAAAASSLLFAKFSPDSSRVAYVVANDVYVEDVASGGVTRLTRDGSATIVNGTSDWVNEEELDLRDGFRWSPDGKRIAFYQFDTSGVGIYTLIDDTDALYPTLTRYPYPKAGQTNSAVRIGIVPAAGGPIAWMRLEGDPRNFYVPRMDWLDDGTLWLEQLNRLQNANALVLADAATGDARVVYRDSSKTWVDYVDEVRWVAGRRAFVWISEKDGWRHVYRANRDGSGEKLLTRFDADVTGWEGMDEKNGWIYVTASPGRAADRYLFRAKLDGSGGAPERVSPAGEPGTHAYELSPDGRWAVHTYSAYDRTPTIDLVALPEHRPARVLSDNAALRAKATPLLREPTEFFTIDVGGVALDGWILKPPGFDPSKKYPLLMYVYGEPAGQTVVNVWGAGHALFHRALADEGYLIASVDNRGTPAPKGAAWRKVIYGAIGDLSSKEQAAAVRALAAARPYIDTGRVGIWGWSGGGTSTLNAMFRYPDVYQVGVSVAPVPDQTLYDTIYQERYMGLPQDNGEGYKRGSPIHYADGLRGRLLVVHGSGDDNVHYQGTERLVNRFVELDRPFDLMVYPNRTHAIKEGKGTSLHLYSRIARYFLEHLPPVPKS